MQTILGGNGTIGSVLAKELKNYTDKIRLVSRNPRKINHDDEIMPADLTDRKEVFRAVQGAEVVYLLVGFDYKTKVWQEKWPPLMRNVIDACIEYGAKLVFFDNVYAYDPQYMGHMTEGTPFKPSSKKGEVRAKVAQMLLDEVRYGTLTGLIARSADFYGPGNDKSVLVETVYKNFLKGKKANWFSSADKVHTFTYTPDAARAVAILGNTKDAYNQTWHLPTSKIALKGKDWVELFAREMNVPARVSVLPKWLVGTIGLFMPFLSELNEMLYQYDRDYVFDSSKFEKHFNFTPITPEEGVRQTIRQNLQI